MKKLLFLAAFLSSLSLLAQPTELTPDKNAAPSNPAYTTIAASNGTFFGNDGNPFVLETRKFQSYAELRAFTGPTPGMFYQAWLSNRIEFWKPDFSDYATPDNNNTTLVGVGGVRWKRFFSSLSSPLTTEFKGTWNASTNQPALTTT
ncbi:hypothetical protein BWI93_00945, partial [Siphonobacter sp. BAB-5385]|uniref:hypothetical protein n=1 Tax=Siphonobacter sp. BAB-5385 TaxID=1864822 RepID=UPI000BDC9FDA